MTGVQTCALPICLLSFHLAHGADSIFQTLGWRSEKWAGLLKRIVVLYCVLYFLGSLAIPGAILTGVAKPAAGTYAAQKLTVAAAPAAVAPR